MKIKYIANLVFIFFALNNAYGQDKNYLFLSIGSPTTPVLVGWNYGIGYERTLSEKTALLFTGDFARSPTMTVLADIDSDSPGSGGGYEDNRFKMDFLLYFRYYPLSTASGRLLIDVGAGYTFLSLEANEKKTTNLLKFQTKIGWKFIKKIIFIQPFVGYNISIGKINFPQEFLNHPMTDIDKYGYINFGLLFGLCF